MPAVSITREWSSISSPPMVSARRRTSGKPLRTKKRKERTVKDGSHDGDVEGTAVEAPVGVVEAALVVVSLSSDRTHSTKRERTTSCQRDPSWVLGDLNVVSKDLGELRLGKSHLLGELCASLKALHESTTAVVLFVRSESASCSRDSRKAKRDTPCSATQSPCSPLR